MPNSRFALHGNRPSLIHGLCAMLAFDSRFYSPVSGPLETCLDSPLLCQPLSSRFALHGLRALDKSQEGTNVHFSNVPFVLCQIFGLNRLTPSFHAFFPPPSLLRPH